MGLHYLIIDSFIHYLLVDRLHLFSFRPLPRSGDDDVDGISVHFSITAKALQPRSERIHRSSHPACVHRWGFCFSIPGARQKSQEEIPTTFILIIFYYLKMTSVLAPKNLVTVALLEVYARVLSTCPTLTLVYANLDCISAALLFVCLVLSEIRTEKKHLKIQQVYRGSPREREREGGGIWFGGWKSGGGLTCLGRSQKYFSQRVPPRPDICTLLFLFILQMRAIAADAPVPHFFTTPLQISAAFILIYINFTESRSTFFCLFVCLFVCFLTGFLKGNEMCLSVLVKGARHQTYETEIHKREGDKKEFSSGEAPAPERLPAVPRREERALTLSRRAETCGETDKRKGEGGGETDKRKGEKEKLQNNNNNNNNNNK
eukprot:gene9445-6628_t